VDCVKILRVRRGLFAVAVLSTVMALAYGSFFLLYGGLVNLASASVALGLAVASASSIRIVSRAAEEACTRYLQK
jgi:Kef-type K+ transport system membrane component KefB